MSAPTHDDPNHDDPRDDDDLHDADATFVPRRAKPPEDDEKFPEWQQRAERLHGRAEVIIGKQRHGPIGDVPLAFEGQFTRFSDLARPERFGAPDYEM